MRITWFTWKDRSHPQAGGAEVVNEELARRLAADGHDVTFLVAGFRGGAASDARDGFRIIRVGGRFTTYLAAARYFRRHRAELAPDLVIDECNTMPYFAGWYAGVPTLLFFHMLCREIWFHQFPQPLSTIGYLLEPLYLRLLRRGPIVTISRSTRHDLMRHGFRDSDIRIISEGIEHQPLRSLASIKKYPQFTVLSLGAMRTMKRTLHHVQAFELAKPALPSLRLVVAGDSSGRYGQKVLQAIMRSPYADDIDYRGHVSAAEKLELMQRSHLILGTSVKEGWGLTITEAASQGTPAVVYDVDGLRDSVVHGQTGLITRKQTPAALARAIQAALRDPKDYERLRRQAWTMSKRINFTQSYADFKKILGGLGL